MLLQKGGKRTVNRSFRMSQRVMSKLRSKKSRNKSKINKLWFSRWKKND